MKNRFFTIADKKIGSGCATFIIAEAGVNHNGELSLAKELIDIASEAGADVVKFQTFTAQGVATSETEQAAYQSKNIGKVESQQSMLAKLALPFEAFYELKHYADRQGIIFMSTPHSEDAIAALDPIVPAYKLGSADLTNLKFLRLIAEKHKPVILGTGMSSLADVQFSLAALKEAGATEIAMLHCTSSYPCPPQEINLRAIKTMQDNLDCQIGYSDHSLGIQIPIMAAMLGATVIEKHFTISRTLPGPDHAASLEPAELKAMVQALRDLPLILGNSEKAPTASEKLNIPVAHKSLVAAKALKAGTILKLEDIATKRIGRLGISAKNLDFVLGKKLLEDLEENAAFGEGLLDEK